MFQSGKTNQNTFHGRPSKIQLDRQLLECSEAGNTADVARLLAQGADPCQNIFKPLVLAASNGHLECVKLFIPVSDPTARDSHALRWASKLGHAECVKLLIPVSDPKASNSAALQDAIDSMQTDCVRLLAPVSGPLLKNKKAWTSALSRGHADIFSIMLACEPLILSGLNLPRRRDAAIAKGQSDLALLLSSLIEQKSLAADLPLPAPSGAAAAQRL